MFVQGQLLRGALLLVDIRARAEELRDATGLGSQRDRPRQEPFIAPGSRPDPKFHVIWSFIAHGPPPRGAGGWDVIRMQRLNPSGTPRFFRRKTRVGIPAVSYTH